MSRFSGSWISVVPISFNYLFKEWSTFHGCAKKGYEWTTEKQTYVSYVSYIGQTLKQIPEGCKNLFRMDTDKTIDDVKNIFSNKSVISNAPTSTDAFEFEWTMRGKTKIW